ncbi:hypothetical protein Halha_1747 [Halobacteroides halobius DSM 5150]|uniref:Glycoside hydrolase family 127 protein n=1 Tax=Halobacteroides halobius (strain ATCC 35273 / DSM 5150 / MD-1) TaxID=748449 RepID=L0KC73_HALHC|nr:beta-L-arabinofuranosidase domain-containing protein [Halobacteroides halobius]AGB41683.1 hypothetical protein Halha_1747 [Halobacteroides halobius DSM 5150]
MRIADNRIQDLSITEVEINDEFWNHRLQVNREVTLKHQYERLESSGRLDNFFKAAGKKGGDYKGMFFNDSDVYKWLEAASYVLANYSDKKLRNRIDKVISIIDDAQEENGYLNTYFTLEEPDKKWTNFGMMHELYCAGHLFQAAVAHYQATNQESLLDIACEFADHIYEVFIRNKKKGIPGHEEIELALIELYQVTKSKKYLELAQYFIDNRGQVNSPFKQELNNLESIAGYQFREDIENYGNPSADELYQELYLDENDNYAGEYAQDHLPVREQDKVVGHAVRAMYLYCGMADVAMETKDHELIQALGNLWANMTKKRMYVTGGIGSAHHNEGFTADYDLPNDTAYAETCAAVGSMMWNQRMLKLTGEACFADIIERTLYNGFLSGVSLTGDKFFYVNPLESDGTHHRKGWFKVSCCPPNIARFLASLEKYIYLKNEDCIFINQYISGKGKVSIAEEEVIIRQDTAYPWDDKVNIKINLKNPSEFTLSLRIPDWCQEASLQINNQSLEIESIINDNGYAQIRRKWRNGDQIRLEFAMPIEKVTAHPLVTQNKDKVALKRGPIIYCLEEMDNLASLDDILLPAEEELEFYYKPDFLEGAGVIKGESEVPDMMGWKNHLYQNVNEVTFRSVEFKAIPYHLWDHRESGKMRVWIRSK